MDGLILWLRSSWISLAEIYSLPNRRFPFNSATVMSPITGLDYHLVHTVIPNPFPMLDSLGAFLTKILLLLASFAKWISKVKN